ncbi:TAXI family TRAP transporter solute-binding subunit [Porticoccaceae bacterium LTM1]|nr:TAXI family TRAP transporter solute-binding subunit [Porticoccaceae bacterium LTM1]
MNLSKIKWIGRCFLVLAVLLTAACSRGPSDEVLKSDLQQRIDKVFIDKLLQVESFKRYGSQPIQSVGGDNAKRLAVYYKANLLLRRDHRFSDWSSQSAGTLHQVLGAASQGVDGLTPEGNRAGDQLSAYGFSLYRQTGDGWELLSEAIVRDDLELPIKTGVVATLNSVQNAQQPESSWQQEFQQQLKSLSVDMARLGLSSEETQMRQQLQSSLTAGELNVLKAYGKTVLLSGSVRGNYHTIAKGIESISPEYGIEMTVVESLGALDNLNLLGRNLAPLALTQSDLAVAAYRGLPPFVQSLSKLRAVAALYPEPIQIVVRKNGLTKSLQDLAGKRVSIGPDGTGTQINARKLLALAGVDDTDFQRWKISESFSEFSSGRLDAFFITGALPSRYLASLGEDAAIIPLEPEIIDQLIQQQGYISYQIPAGIYPGVDEPVATVAVTALLVANRDVPDETVQALLKSLYSPTKQHAMFGEHGASLELDRALTAVGIPLHPVAEKFLSERQQALVH